MTNFQDKVMWLVLVPAPGPGVEYRYPAYEYLVAYEYVA